MKAVREHGTGTAYQYGCRCDRCKAANAQAARDNRLRRKNAQADPAVIPHGLGGYNNWGCRCTACARAHREYESSPRGKATKGRYGQSEKGRATLQQWWTENLPGIRRRNAARDGALLDGAVNYGKEWTGPELELASREDLTAPRVAQMLGRSYHAVRWVRRQLREADPRKRTLRDGPERL